ncbi:MAG: hypothetical protein QOG43_2968 [Actinomycetota bacterium]|jgi:hypothetical protein|nr:hypothetical protein [Actinomycetota bacterium]
MTIDIEDRLRRDLAAAVAAPVRPAPPLQLLERQARPTTPLVGRVASSSRRRSFALVAVAAAIVVAVATLGVRPLHMGTSADATASCRDAFAEPGQPEEADGLRYLPADVPAGFRLRNASAGVQRPCKPSTVALVLLDEADGVLRRAVTVWGPDVSDTDFFSPDSIVRGDGSPANRRTTVRGTEAKLAASGQGPRDGHTLGWTEPRSGQRWIVTSIGLTSDELTSLVEALHVGAGVVSVDETAAPGFASETLQPPAPIGKQVTWNVDYEPDSGVAIDSDISVGVGHGDLAAELSRRSVGLEVLEVDGHRAATFSQGASTFLEVQLAPGVTTHLSGPVSVGELDRLVASLQPVDAHDPRIPTLPSN